MNVQIVGGNLTQQAKVTLIGEREMLSFTVASNDGPDYTDYMNCVVWGKPGFAENVLPFLSKGQGVMATGEINYQKPSEKDNVVYNNVIIQLDSLRDLEMIGGKKTQPADGITPPTPEEMKANEAGDDAARMASDTPPSTPDYDSFDDDIPF